MGLTSKVRDFFFNTTENAKAWKQVLTSPRLRQQYKQEVLRPAVMGKQKMQQEQKVAQFRPVQQKKSFVNKAKSFASNVPYLKMPDPQERTKNLQSFLGKNPTYEKYLYSAINSVPAKIGTAAIMQLSKDPIYGYLVKPETVNKMKQNLGAIDELRTEDRRGGGGKGQFARDMAFNFPFYAAFGKGLEAPAETVMGKYLPQGGSLAAKVSRTFLKAVAGETASSALVYGPAKAITEDKPLLSSIAEETVGGLAGRAIGSPLNIPLKMFAGSIALQTVVKKLQIDELTKRWKEVDLKQAGLGDASGHKPEINRLQKVKEQISNRIENIKGLDIGGSVKPVKPDVDGLKMKQEPEKLENLLKIRTPSVPTTKIEVQTKELSEKYNLDEGFIRKLQTQFDRSEIVRAVGYVDDSATPIKDRESYIVDALRTKIYSQPKSESVKISRAEEPSMEDLKIGDKTAGEIEMVSNKPETMKVKEEAPVKIEEKSPLLPDLKKFKSQDRATQIGSLKDLQFKGNKIVADILNKVKSQGIDESEWIADIESGGQKHPQLFAMHKMLMDHLAENAAVVDPDFKTLENYFPHMTLEGREIGTEIGDGLWISAADLSLGNLDFHRTGSLTDYSRDYATVMKHYMNQIASKVYLPDTKMDNSYQQAVVDYSKKVFDAVKAKSGEAKKIEAPDFVSEGNKVNKAAKEKLTKSKYKLTGIGDTLLENNRVMKGIGGKLYSSWQNLRDVETKFIKREWQRNTRLEKEALQDLVTTAGKYKFKNGVTKEYVNNLLANKISTRQIERGIMEKISNIFVTTTARAHLGLSVKTGLLQILEATKVPFLYGKDAVTGLKVSVTDAKRLSKEYALDEFASAYDLKRLQGELTNILGVGKAVQELGDKILFAPITAGEKIKNVYFSAAAEAYGKKKGMEGEELTHFVRDQLFEYGHVASKNNRAKIFEKWWGRLLLQYGQYTLKNTNSIAEALKNKEVKKAIGLSASSLLNSAIIVALTGLPVKYAVEQLVPLSPGPAFTLPMRLFELSQEDWSDETKEKKAKRMLMQNVMPAGTQQVRTTEGLQASEGYDFTPSGRARFYGDKTSLPIKILGGVFGKNALPDVKQYYKEGRSAFGENQTKEFLEQGSDYGKMQIQRRKDDKTDKELKEAGTMPDIKVGLPTDAKELGVLYKQHKKTLEAYDDKKTKIDYADLTDDQKKDKLYDLNRDKRYAEEMVNKIESDQPEKVFEFQLDTYKSGGGMNVDERGDWAAEEIQKAIEGADTGGRVVITQGFGNYNPSVEKFSGGVNTGADLRARPGTPVTIPQGTWKVTEVSGGGSGKGANKGYGNSVIVQNPQGESLRFSHLSGVSAQKGQVLKQGDLVGLSGDTGNTYGAHLDVEYRKNGQLGDVTKTKYGTSYVANNALSQDIINKMWDTGVLTTGKTGTAEYIKENYGIDVYSYTGSDSELRKKINDYNKRGSTAKKVSIKKTSKPKAPKGIKFTKTPKFKISSLPKPPSMRAPKQIKIAMPTYRAPAFKIKEIKGLTQGVKLL